MKVYAFADEASPSLFGQIAAMKRNGLAGIEIRNVDGVNVSDLSLHTAQKIKAQLDAAGLTVWSIGSPLGKIGVADDFAPHLEKCRRTYEIANALGTKRVRMFSFYIPKEKQPEDYQNAVVERIGKMLEAAEEQDVYLCHENEKGIFGDTPKRCRLLLEVFPALHCVFDPANFIQCGADPLAAFELLKNRVDYLHIKDAKLDGSVVPAGAGVGNIPKILTQCRTLGIEHATIEPHLTVFSGLKALEQEGEQSKIDEFAYPNPDAAFDAACSAFGKLL